MPGVRDFVVSMALVGSLASQSTAFALLVYMREPRCLASLLCHTQMHSCSGLVPVQGRHGRLPCCFYHLHSQEWFRQFDSKPGILHISCHQIRACEAVSTVPRGKDSEYIC